MLNDAISTNTDMSHEDKPSRQVRVWDRFVRSFHWALVVCIALNLFVLESGKSPHEWTGYIAATLIILRIVWGFVGSTYARFADFFPTPSRLHHHFQVIRHGQNDNHPGHNPLGALMMLVLMTLVIALGVTGWMQGLDAYWGEEWLQDLHALLSNTLMVMAGLHVCAALVMSKIERVNLVKAMITGTKEYRS